MKLEDLWIGDRVIIKNGERLGVFQGIHKKGKARILFQDKILLVPSTGIILAPDKKRKNSLDDQEAISPVKKQFQEKLSFYPEIDLHMDKLQASKQHDNPVAILEFQLRKLTEFLDKAVSLRVPKVNIIHGKGTGALRMETYNIIENYPEKQSLYPINNDGGVTLYFQYFQ